MTQPGPDQWICVSNSEGRWSVWPANLPVPAGWQAKSTPADRSACLAEIEVRWADPRPEALQEAMA